MRAPEVRAKIWNVLLDSGIFMHLEEMAAQIVDLFARLGGEGCWSTLSTPPLATGLSCMLQGGRYENFKSRHYSAFLNLQKEKDNVVQTCVYGPSRYRFSQSRTSCGPDNETLSLKYMVERAQFFVSLKLKKIATYCSVEKKRLNAW